MLLVFHSNLVYFQDTGDHLGQCITWTLSHDPDIIAVSLELSLWPVVNWTVLHKYTKVMSEILKLTQTQQNKKHWNLRPRDPRLPVSELHIQIWVPVMISKLNYMVHDQLYAKLVWGWKYTQIAKIIWINIEIYIICYLGNVLFNVFDRNTVLSI